MNRPVQVMFESEDRRRARRRAAELGLTLTEYVRRLVLADLDGWTPDDDTPAIIPIDDSGEPIPPRKDIYIGEAVAARFAQSDHADHADR